MTSKHICWAIRIGVSVEIGVIGVAVYGSLWIVCWVGEHLPGWVIFPLFMLLFAIGFRAVFHHYMPKKRTIRGYRRVIKL